MIGAAVVTVKSTHCAMVSASGSLPGAVLLLLMFLNQATTSFAIASCLQMLHSATVHISIFGSGAPRITVVSGPSLVLAPSGSPWVTGCLPSTSELHIHNSHITDRARKISI